MLGPLIERLASDFRYSRAREIVKSRSSCCHRAQVSKIVDDEKNGLIGAVRHDRRGPTGAAHGQYSTNTIRQFRHEIRNRSCTKNEAPEPQLRGSQTQPSTSARYGVRLSYALVDAAMPPISRAGLFRAREIWIDDALCRAARCRRLALRQRRVAAIVIVGPPLLVNMQANRISRIVRLSPYGRRRRNRRNRQNHQSRNAHQSLLRDIRAESPTKRDAIPHQSAPCAGRQIIP